ncbi:MAG: conjugal transfer protein TraD [Lamprobacter sp.]|uniref:conjugal transfer protein TraD n=1 Tax=Lamprobacter sp. TaxID=3100796 RepID=UPI002B25C435|nr:conjugal transfer protein TraD [Lamprobacter sp.]MEA3642141.1 conjugal transfer protein TraD [Lamprobacter sp.]
MTRTTDQELLSLNIPGTRIELDPGTAEELGAFEEQALTEDEALASADIPAEYLPEQALEPDEEGA